MSVIAAESLPTGPPTEATHPGNQELELVRRAGSEPEAFAVLYRMHYRPIAGYLYRRTGDVHVSEDLAAETFMAAYRAIGSFQLGEVPLRYWLLRIATNAANRWAKRERLAAQRRAIALALGLGAVASPPSSAVTMTEGRDDVAKVRAALARLAPKFQTVISLHYFESLDIESIALVLECAPGTVKSRLHRARAAMKKVLDKGERS